MIIVFEGIDGAGKTTQVRSLKDYYENQGKKCSILKCPDRHSPTGALIDSYLKGDCMLSSPQIANLILAANIWEVAEEAKKRSSLGEIVIMDRYKYTHVAYSMARGSPRRACESVLEGVVEADKIVFLDIKPEPALARKPPGQLEVLENPVFQTKVYNNYQSMITPDWIVVNADQDQELVHEQIIQGLNI